MTKEEFRLKLEEFFRWVGNKACESSYWASLEEFAAHKFNETYQAEEAKEKNGAS